MPITINNITYELMPQPKKPAPYCCDGCAAADEAAVDCEDFKGLCSRPENLDKVWKRVETNEQIICPHCKKYKRMQGNGILHQMCECGESIHQ